SRTIVERRQNSDELEHIALAHGTLLITRTSSHLCGKAWIIPYPEASNVKKVTQTFSDERILVKKHTALGRITIDRPRAIGALDAPMVEAIAQALTDLAGDTDIDTLLLDATDDRGFCAGGDLRRLHEQITGGDIEGVDRFFRAEYTLNAAIAEFPHPVVTFANGVTMGGGVGLACHAPVRIVTETSRLAMPETRIGFTPDVGGTLLLARAPGRIGEYLALT